MKSCRRFIVCTVFLLLTSALAIAQNAADIFGDNQLNVTFIGIDFSKAHYFGDTANISPDKVKNLLNNLNILTVTEHKKYNLSKAFRKPNMKTEIAFTTERNKAIDVDKFFLPDTPNYLTFRKL